MNLQDAQDTMQAAGVFFSRSTDATGKGRRPDTRVGVPIGAGEAVLSVGKCGESNPC
ncbi:calcium-binding protein [Nocardia thailandica]|uniref:calcium-binding protein n=1 Tax=Nocardia thailandica TaxID=257275 RepID=UPI001FDF6BEB|nr:calcium-binding protein [Nocardia thailandica]